MVYCIYLWLTGYSFQIKIVLHFLKNVFALTNSVDPDEMLHYELFYLGPHCLPEYAFGLNSVL